jgi:zinc protease
MFTSKNCRWPGYAALLFLIVGIMTTGTAWGGLPSGEKVFKAYVKASGGEKAYKKIDTRVTKGAMKMPAMGIEGAMTIYSARPNKQFVSISMPGMGEMKSGTDGNVCWETSMMSGPRVKEGVEREMGLREALFDGLLGWKDLFASLECVAEEDVDGVACYKVVATPKTGAVETYYFNKETDLIHKTLSVMESEMGEIPIEAFYSDYTEVDGIKIAFTLRQMVMGNEMLMITESVEHGVELAADQFAIPADVSGLLEK